MDQWRLHVSEDEMLCESPAGAVRCDDVMGCRYLVMRYFDSMLETDFAHTDATSDSSIMDAIRFSG